MHIFDQNFVFFTKRRQKLLRLLDAASKLALFSVSGLKDEQLIKKCKPTWKLKHANSILETFWYFCQILSKQILIILSYTVSKLVHFLRHSVCLLRSSARLCQWKNHRSTVARSIDRSPNSASLSTDIVNPSIVRNIHQLFRRHWQHEFHMTHTFTSAVKERLIELIFTSRALQISGQNVQSSR